MSSAAQAWATALGRWAIPPHILASASHSPWGLPVERFACRARAALSQPRGWSYERAASAVVPGGSVLDVGAGVGAASLPLVSRIPGGFITAVDTSTAMLDAFTAASAPFRSVRSSTVVGEWPTVAPSVPAHDVVVAHHVVYNVADIEPFVSSLTDHARTRVVVELPPAHPLSYLTPLWQRFWDLDRPNGPTSDDFLAVIDEAGVRDVVHYRWTRDDPDPTTVAERAAIIARRLCLPDERIDEVAEALVENPIPQRRDVVTVAWSGGAR